MTVPDPEHPDLSRPDRPPGVARPPGSGLDPMPTSRPGPRAPDPSSPGPNPPGPNPPGPLGPPSPGPGEVPDPSHLVLVATGREDRRRHVVDVPAGELGDPQGLRARCGAAVEAVVPGLRAGQADCPGCRLPVLR